MLSPYPRDHCGETWRRQTGTSPKLANCSQGSSRASTREALLFLAFYRKPLSRYGEVLESLERHSHSRRGNHHLSHHTGAVRGGGYFVRPFNARPFNARTSWQEADSPNLAPASHLTGRVYCLALPLFKTRKPPEHNLVVSPAHRGFVMGSQGRGMRFGKGDETQW
jgi:hypothetical protein